MPAPLDDKPGMTHLGTRYAALLTCIFLMFGGFVACGSQLYKVSMTDDTTLSSTEGTTDAEMNDPKSPSFGLHAPDGWTKLPIHFRTGYTLTAEQRKLLQAAMGTWETAVGKKLFVYDGPHANVTGDSFKDLYSSLDDKINGHYLDDDWAKTGKPSVVLATTIWDNDPADVKRIITADIRFNAHYYLLGDSFTTHAVDEREVVDMQTLALHELGHLLGLAHMSPVQDSQSIMTPSLYIGEGLANRRLSKGDLERIHKIYGCSGEACDVDKTLARIDKLDLDQRREQRVESDTAH